MIVVRVELHHASQPGKVTELARMEICNDGTGTDRRCHYFGRSLVGRSTEALDRRQVSKSARVSNWPRHDLHIWNLVRRMLDAMGYTRGPTQ